MGILIWNSKAVQIDKVFNKNKIDGNQNNCEPQMMRYNNYFGLPAGTSLSYPEWKSENYRNVKGNSNPYKDRSRLQTQKGGRLMSVQNNQYAKSYRDPITEYIAKFTDLTYIPPGAKHQNKSSPRVVLSKIKRPHTTLEQGDNNQKARWNNNFGKMTSLRTLQIDEWVSDINNIIPKAFVEAFNKLKNDNNVQMPYKNYEKYQK